MSTADPFDTPYDSVDPFDLPPFDPTTGEVLEVVDAEVADVPQSAIIPVDLAGTAVRAVTAVNPADLAAFTGDLRAALDKRVGETYGALVSQRPEGAPTPEVVAPELAWLADAHDVFAALGKVFTDQAKGVRSVAGDVVLEVRTDRSDLERTGGSASLKVGTASAPGSAIKVTTTQPTETFTDTPAIVDVLVPYVIDRTADAHDSPDQAGVAIGARAMARVLLGLEGHYGLLAAPKWKSTALETLRGELQGMGQTGAALASRLAKGFGRRPKGSVTVDIERTQMREVRDL